MTEIVISVILNLTDEGSNKLKDMTLTDPKDRKNNRISSNAPNITDDALDQNDTDVQDRLEDALVEADEEMRRERYNFDDDDTDVTSNAPNITDTPPREEDERR